MQKEVFLKEECAKIGIELNERQIEQFLKYYELLVEWNKVMNLTGITEYKEVVIKHFVDSLSLVKVMNLKGKKAKVIDLGTGAGFPGIPLKIAFPECEFLLVDSLNKRVKFLQEVINQLELSNITALHGRAETLGKNAEYREQFDICVSRAVANMAVLAEYCIPFVKVGGMFLPYKSGEIKEELQGSKKALSILGGELGEVTYFELPDTDIKRAIVSVKKITHTGKAYPRNDGKPSKEPLK